MTFKIHDGVEIDGKSLTNSGGTLTWGGVSVGSGGGVTISSNANNRVLTGDGSNAVGETNLTFDGTNLQIVGSSRGLITEKLRLGATDTSFIERDSTVNIGYRADGVHRFWTYNSSWLERAQITDTGFNLLAGHSYQLGGTTVIDSSRNLTNIGTISSGNVTASRFIQNTSTGSNLYAVEFSRSGSGTTTPDIWGTSNTLVLGTSSSVEAVGFSGANAQFYGTISSGALAVSGQSVFTGAGTSNTYQAVIKTVNSSSDQWGHITLSSAAGNSVTNNYYLIGRGSAVSDRQMSFHIPTANNYGSGSEPIFRFASSGSDNLMTITANTGAVYVKGNITVGGTVDGRDVAADGTKLDGIAAGANNFSLGNTITVSSDIQTTGGLLKFTSNNHVLTTNNTNNILFKSGNTGTMGLLGQNSGGQFRWQIYGDGSNYGFLDGNWANWDLQKAVNGAFKVDEGSGLKRVLNEANWTSYISNNNQLTNGAGYQTASTTSLSNYMRVNASNNVSSSTYKTRWYSSSAINTTTGSASSLEVYGNNGAGTDAFMTFHVENDFAIYLGLDGGTNKLSVGGWSMGANSYEIYHAGNKPSLATLGFTGASNANNYSFPYSISTAATANNVVLRDSGGDITGRYYFGVHFNQSSSNSENPTIGAFWTNSTSDTYCRKSTPAHVGSQLSSHINYNNIANKPTIPTNNNQLTNGAGYITSADGGNATTLDGLDLHTGRNNVANRVVRTDSNGYIQAGWINTTSGSTTTAISRIYASNDGYIRYYTADAYLNSGGMGEKIFNNQAQTHSSSTNFNTDMPAGVHYMQQGTNGPTGTASHQFYGVKFGLGSDYGTTSGGSTYSSQMYYPRAGQGGGNGLYFRDMEGGSWQSWRQVDAGTLTGAAPSAGSSAIGASQIMKSHTNNYIYTNWINVGGQGMYSGTNGAHLYPNTATTYGTWRINGARNSYTGIMLDNGGDVVIGMYDSSGNGGIYGEGSSGWEQYYNRGNACLGITASTTSSSYSLYVTGAIYATGDIVGSSDERLKTEIKTIPNALDKVLQLRGVTYKWKEEEEAEENNVTPERMGVIAQEVLDIVPEVVTHDKENDRYGVSYGHLTGVLIEAIKELKQEVNELKKELEEVKNG